MIPVPLITIAILTYNSSKTLRLVFEGVKRQTLDPMLIDLMIVDGGSKDDTLAIAARYGARVVHNLKTEMISGRQLGICEARGRYICFIDHDEVLENPNSLTLKLQILKENANVRAVVGSGYTYDKSTPMINLYINEFGDPFSYFIYKSSKDSNRFPVEMDKKFLPISSKADYSIFNFNETYRRLPIIEITTSGAVVDLFFLKEQLPELLENPQELVHLLFYFCEKSAQIAITKSDGVLHYSAETLNRYLLKIRWRIINNIHYKKSMGSAGFSGRLKFHPLWVRIKQMLFVPYGLTFIAPLIDAIYLSISRGQPFFLIHTYLSFYTAKTITIELCKKMMGISSPLLSYDATKMLKKQE